MKMYMMLTFPLHCRQPRVMQVLFITATSIQRTGRVMLTGGSLVLASRWAFGAAARAAFAMEAASHAFCSCAACAAAAAAAGVSEGDRAGDKTSGVNGAGLVASSASYGNYLRTPLRALC